MGQEISYCSACGVQLRGADFEKGAVRREAAAYCRACATQAGLSPEQSAPAKSSPHNTRRAVVAASSATGRIPIATPRRGTDAVGGPRTSPALIWGGGLALGVVLALAAAVMLGSSSSRSSTSESESSRSVGSPRVQASAPVAPAREASKTALPSTESADLAAIDRRIAEAVASNRFREALYFLESERKRHDSLEWTSGLQRCVAAVDVAAKKKYQELQAKMDEARRRGADGEVRAMAAVIASWGLPAYPPVPDATPAPVALAPAAAAIPAAPEPVAAAPAAVPAPAPAVASAPPKAAPIPFVAGPMKWSVLTPLRATASQGSRLTILEDGSLLADGDSPAVERYAVWVQTDLKGANAIRLEALPDPSLPGSGPGRSDNGNFVLTEFQVQLLTDAKAESGTPVAIEKAAAEYEQNGLPIAHAFDGRNDTGWAIYPLHGRALDAVFELRAPLPTQAPVTLLFILDHASVYANHQLGRFRLSASMSKGASSEVASRPPPPVDQAPVDAAIRRGVDWLRRSGSPGCEFGAEKKLQPIRTCDELILLTFIHSGVPENDPRFQQLLASTLTGPYTHTYTVALRAMALEELDRVRYQPHIARCAQFLVDNQLSSGQWSYGEPTIAVETIKADVAPAASAAPRAAAAASTPKPKPKVVQKITVRPTRSPAGNGDVSNSQYAALGIRACVDAGIVIPKDVFVRAVQAYTLAQLQPTTKDVPSGLAPGRKPRGWCYDSPCACPLHRPYGTTTAGAVSSLAIYDHLLSRDAKRDAAVQDGLAWLQVNYAIDTVPGPIEWDKISKNTYVPYYLYALERAMILTGNERFGTHSWYADGVRYLLDNQKADGSWWIDDWGRDVWDTCFALLFLKRSTRPLVASTDRFHPDDERK